MLHWLETCSCMEVTWQLLLPVALSVKEMLFAKRRKPLLVCPASTTASLTHQKTSVLIGSNVAYQGTARQAMEWPNLSREWCLIPLSADHLFETHGFYFAKQISPYRYAYKNHFQWFKPAVAVDLHNFASLLLYVGMIHDLLMSKLQKYPFRKGKRYMTNGKEGQVLGWHFPYYVFIRLLSISIQPKLIMIDLLIMASLGT